MGSPAQIPQKKKKSIWPAALGAGALAGGGLLAYKLFGQNGNQSPAPTTPTPQPTPQVAKPIQYQPTGRDPQSIVNNIFEAQHKGLSDDLNQQAYTGAGNDPSKLNDLMNNTFRTGEAGLAAQSLGQLGMGAAGLTNKGIGKVFGKSIPSPTPYLSSQFAKVPGAGLMRGAAKGVNTALGKPLAGLGGYMMGSDPLVGDAWGEMLGVDPKKMRPITGAIGGLASTANALTGTIGSSVGMGALDKAKNNLTSSVASGNHMGNSGQLLLHALKSMKRNQPDANSAMEDAAYWLGMNKDNVAKWKSTYPAAYNLAGKVKKELLARGISE